MPATISPYVVAAIGSRASRRYFTTAERFSAETALQLGLLSEVVAEEDLDNGVEQLLEQLLANSPAAVRAAKALVFDVAEQAINDNERSDELIATTSERIAAIRLAVAVIMRLLVATSAITCSPACVESPAKRIPCRVVSRSVARAKLTDRISVVIGAVCESPDIDPAPTMEVSLPKSYS